MNDRQPRLSVIIPTYNRASLVDRCVRSLRNCGIPDLEIIIVDDGGTDDTPDVARAHGAVYIRQANAGPAEARNNGFANSHGQYVAFIDSDDEWTNGGAARLVAQMEANPDVSVIFADSLMGNTTDGFVSFVRTYGSEAFFTLPHESRAGIRILSRQPLFLQLSTRNVMFLASMVIRRDFFEAIGGFDRDLRGAADWDFFMRATAGGVIAYSDGVPVSLYHKHDAGMSTDSDHMAEDFIRALDSTRRRSALDPIERSHVDQRIRSHVFGWAWGAYDRGDFSALRKRLRLAWTLGEFKSREAFFFALSWLPPGLVMTMRRGSHRLTRNHERAPIDPIAQAIHRRTDQGPKKWAEGNETVSVVIPCFNAQAYLIEALASIRTQTLPAVEIIVVDDGSTVPLWAPDTWNGPPLRIIRTANQGQAAARNVGLARASGDFIALLDADDTWHPSKLEKQVQALQSDANAIACYTQCAKGPGLFPFGPYPPGDVSDGEFLLMLWYHSFFPPSAVMFRRAAIADIGVFDEKLRGPEDIEYWFRLMTAGRIIQVPEPLCLYRQHAAQFTADLYRKISAGKRARVVMMQRYDQELVRAGLRRDKFWDAYRNEILIAYYRRQFAAARPLLWNYWRDHPGDLNVLSRAAISLLPERVVAGLRGTLESPASRVGFASEAGDDVDPGWWAREFQRITPVLTDPERS